MSTDISAASRAERRRWRRSQTSLIATINYNRLLLPCLIADISLGGARVKLLEPAKLPLGPAVVECSRFGCVTAELVWQKGLFVGFKFGDPAAFGEQLRQASAQPAPASWRTEPAPRELETVG